MTATPHRGNERLFRSLMHLVDPEVFPEPSDADGESSYRLRPGPLHFLRRMKEEIVDLDGATKLFKPREARNVRRAAEHQRAGVLRRGARVWLTGSSHASP